MLRKGGIVWLTGLSGAGKTTLATAVSRRLAAQRPVEMLDGDEMRAFLTAGLSYSKTDRDANVQCIAYVARLLAKHGVLVFVAAISPYVETRADVKRRSEAAGHAFLEVFVNARLETVVDRDAKGLYKKALAGEIPNFTGVSDPYEIPPNPTVEVRTDEETLESCEQRIVNAIVSAGLL